jgi:hypothetical protein
MTSQDDQNNYAKDTPYKTKTGFHAGVTAAFSLGDKFGIEPGVLFSVKGFAEEFSSANIKYTINYVEVPINAVYKIDVGRPKVLIFAGPYLAMLYPLK